MPRFPFHVLPRTRFLRPQPETCLRSDRVVMRSIPACQDARVRYKSAIINLEDRSPFPVFFTTTSQFIMKLIALLPSFMTLIGIAAASPLSPAGGLLDLGLGVRPANLSHL